VHFLLVHPRMLHHLYLPTGGQTISFYQTLETLQKTKVRLETALEVDKSLDKYQRAAIRDILDIVSRLIDEATTPQDAS